MSHLTVLGIDPGTAVTGYGVVRQDGTKLTALDYGCVRTDSKASLPHRLLKLYRELSALIGRFSPDAVAVEQIFFNRNVRSALAVGQARGVALLAAARADVPVLEYTPLEVKQAVVGYGRADKCQVQRMVMAVLRLPETPAPDDVADALAVAVCCLHSRATRRRWEGEGA